MKTAVVYYSRFGHTSVVAEEIGRVLDAEVRQVDTPKHEQSYPYMGFASTFNVRMKLKETDLDFSGYDLLVLCTPIWAWKPAPPGREVLLEGKLPSNLAVCFSIGGSPTQRAQEKVRQMLEGRGVEVVAFGEIVTDKVTDDDLRREARIFAERLKGQ
jgi:flavodoxin